MGNENNLPQLIMYADLANLPELNLPQDISIRSLGDGDDKIWVDIMRIAFNAEYNFDDYMKNDSAYKPERILFACVDGVPVASASAWYRERYEANTGYLHMVGALPEYKGRKLGYLVSLAAMIKMKKDGYTRVVLQTDDFRLPAIKTYIDLGFEIDFNTHSSIPERWEKIKNILSEYKK